MLNLLFDPFINNGFLANALIGGLFVSIACAIAGSFMVLRGMAFIGDALSHGVLPGVALALIFGLPGMIGAAIGSLVMIGGIGFVTRKTSLASDTAIGLLFVGMLALGVILVSGMHGVSGDLIKLLFGEVLGIAPLDILIQALATLLLAFIAFAFRRPFLLLCFSPEQAEVAGFSAKRYHAVMLGMIALTVIVAFQTVGTLLVFGMLVAPAAAAAIISRRIGAMIVVAALIGALSTFVGLLSSYYFDLAAGPSIVVIAVLVFFATLVVSTVLRNRAAKAVKA